MQRQKDQTTHHMRRQQADAMDEIPVATYKVLSAGVLCGKVDWAVSLYGEPSGAGGGK